MVRNDFADKMEYWQNTELLYNLYGQKFHIANEMRKPHIKFKTQII